MPGYIFTFDDLHMDKSLSQILLTPGKIISFMQRSDLNNSSPALSDYI